MTEHKYTVFDHAGKIIGKANNFGDAKNLHKANLPEDLLVGYAGLDLEQLSRCHLCVPSFYTELLSDDIRAKYGLETAV